MRYLKFFRGLKSMVSTSALVFMVGCAAPPAPAPIASKPAPPSPAPDLAETARPLEPVIDKAAFTASTLAYRKEAAQHLYGHNTHRIFKGKMPPLLYAIGVLQIEVDKKGQVMGTHWMRAPSQAPEVVAEIERTVRLAAPFPVPTQRGGVVYTDTWLWHKSGRFQLDTLTEGQL